MGGRDKASELLCVCLVSPARALLFLCFYSFSLYSNQCGIASVLGLIGRRLCDLKLSVPPAEHKSSRFLTCRRSSAISYCLCVVYPWQSKIKKGCFLLAANRCFVSPYYHNKGPDRKKLHCSFGLGRRNNLSHRWSCQYARQGANVSL